MQFKAKAFIERLKLEKKKFTNSKDTERLWGKIFSKLVKIERCQIFYLLKTSQHLDGHYLLIDNLSFPENGEGKNIYNCHRKNINIITNCIQTLTYIDNFTL